MQVPILSGIYANATPELGIAYPVNMVPVALPSGVSNGYLRPADGFVPLDYSPSVVGVDRGGINWDGLCYRVIGTKLVRVNQSGDTTVLGDVGSGGRCAFDYGYTTLVEKTYVAYLAILSGGRLYYYSPTASPTFQQVTDVNLGSPIDLVWANGYFVLTDGTYVFNMELANPFVVGSGEYGTTDADPDPIVALLKLRNEIYVLNRHTVQILTNTGQPVVGNFTWSTVDGGQITKGCIGTDACCIFEQQIAFLGSGRNEAPGIYVGASSTSQKISTVEIDRLLASYTEAQLATAVLEARNDNAHRHLYVHLPDRTVAFDAAASQQLGRPVWFTLTTSKTGFSQYRARGLVWVYDKWMVGDVSSTGYVGYLDATKKVHWDENVRWEFSTPIVYNESSGAIFHELELVALPGRQISGNPTISTSYSLDGANWSTAKSINVGASGDTTKRLCWFQQGFMESVRIQRFQGDFDAHVPVLRLEARLEPLEH